MLEEIKIIRMYNLVNPKGKRLQLRLGVMQLEPQEKYYGDTGYRWSFLGREIPMPVRNGTWFNGFPHDTMMLWLAEHEWHVETEVNMLSGKAKVYGLPEPEDEYEELQLIADEQVFYNLVKELLCNNDLDKALAIVRYAHEISTRTAMEIIKNID